VYYVEAGWCWQWPGWPWVAANLNEDYGNNRTPQACRAKYDRIMREANAALTGAEGVPCSGLVGQEVDRG